MQYKDSLVQNKYGYELPMPKGELRILQLTDTQVIDSTQMRTPDRLNPIEIREWVPERKTELCYTYIEEAVRKAKPHLIIFTGDLVYGSFDDNGCNFTEMVAYLDSFHIPWAPVFGNHDNETCMGVDWQCEQFKKSEYCLFQRGKTLGNGNYTVTLTRGNKAFRHLFMIDSNPSAGISATQSLWMEEALKEFARTYGATLPFFVCFHMPSADFADAAVEAGYQPCPDSPKKLYSYNIGIDIPARNGDFGTKANVLGSKYITTGRNEHFTSICKNWGCDGMFTGHCHNINTSILYNNIRYTFGLKTGLYDYFAEDLVGGTLIELKGSEHGAFTAKHLYTDRKTGKSLRYKSLPAF